MAADTLGLQLPADRPPQAHHRRSAADALILAGSSPGEVESRNAVCICVCRALTTAS